MDNPNPAGPPPGSLEAIAADWYQRSGQASSFGLRPLPSGPARTTTGGWGAPESMAAESPTAGWGAPTNPASAAAPTPPASAYDREALDAVFDAGLDPQAAQVLLGMKDRFHTPIALGNAAKALRDVPAALIPARVEELARKDHDFARLLKSPTPQEQAPTPGPWDFLKARADAAKLSGQWGPKGMG